MPYVSTDYANNTKAPLGQWTCTRTSSLGPYDSTPPAETQGNPNYCGQCVSFVTTVCPTLPVSTHSWRKGGLVKGDSTIAAGTAIATFDANGRYNGHAAIYENQTDTGINVVDQWVTPPAQAIHRRMLRFGARGLSNNGDNFYVIE